MNDRLTRQSFLGPNHAVVLERLRVAIVGLGGGGSHIAQQLAHVGVGEFVLIDPDKVEESNLNRLVGATVADASRRAWKAAVALRTIRRVNPLANARVFRAKWQEHAEALRDCDVIFGCVDSFAARNELERNARRYLTPYIDIGMDVHSYGGNFAITGQVALSMPGFACLHCMGVIRPDLLANEAARYGEAGSMPQVVWPNGVLASTAVGLMMRLVTPWYPNEDSLSLLEYDGNTHEVRASSAVGHLIGKACSHFQTPSDLGDPWFQMPRVRIGPSPRRTRSG